METAQFLNACDEIANDPYTKFLVAIWRDDDGDDKDAGEDEDEDIIPEYTKLLGPDSPAQPAPDPLDPAPPNPAPPNPTPPASGEG
jgi:hypothetical protein